jgi:thioredoxin reductase (NADPH)
MKEKIYDAIIIGAGPAGLASAIYTSRGHLSTIVFTGSQPGGQLTLTTDVDDYPGFPDGIQGPELMNRMTKQAEKMGAEIVMDIVKDVDLSGDIKKVFVGDKTHLGKTVIIATGASARWLGLDSEKALVGRGVSGCAVCDGPFFKGKKITVIGGGDAALREALFLSRYGSSVKIIHRRDKLRAFKALQDQVFEHPNIDVIWDSTVEKFVGDDKLESLKLKNVKTGEVSDLECDGAFVAIGHKPNTDFLKGHVDLDDHGYIVVSDEVKTNVDGVFAAGDVHDFKYKQAATAVGAGTKAALEVDNFLEGGHQL